MNIWYHFRQTYWINYLSSIVKNYIIKVETCDVLTFRPSDEGGVFVIAILS